jgi:DNA-binding HxlR family transcriptional regulator
MKKVKKKKRGKMDFRPSALPEPSKMDGFGENPADESLPYALNLIGGKWKLRILWVLRNGESLRYGEIKQRIPSITDMMLSQSLRELTADELTMRCQYQQIPPRVEYQITPIGAELIPAITLLNAWAVKNRKEPA